MLYDKLSLILLVIIPIVWTATDYCSLSCGNKHIACNNDGSFSSQCASNAKIIPITSALKTQIVSRHNQYRNKIAQGFSKFKPAVRMATMVWSDELAKIATFNVKQCEMKHDKCRATKSFPYSGQNLAKSKWSGQTKSIPNNINVHIDKWYIEYKNVPLAVIDKFYSPKNGKNYGHFTAMMQEKSTHVGCAIMKQIQNGSLQQLMACNYAYTNVENKPIYQTGTAASKCKTGVNSTYKFLCSTNENYDVATIR